MEILMRFLACISVLLFASCSQHDVCDKGGIMSDLVVNLERVQYTDGSIINVNFSEYCNFDYVLANGKTEIVSHKISEAFRDGMGNFKNKRKIRAEISGNMVVINGGRYFEISDFEVR